MKRESHEECAALVGLDWADATHDVYLQATGTERREFLILDHRPEASDAWGHWRLQCPTFLRQTCVERAAASTRHAFWAQVAYQQQREQGKAHQAAVRALACTWLHILSRCWQERTPV